MPFTLVFNLPDTHHTRNKPLVEADMSPRTLLHPSCIWFCNITPANDNQPPTVRMYCLLCRYCLMPLPRRRAEPPVIDLGLRIRSSVPALCSSGIYPRTVIVSHGAGMDSNIGALVSAPPTKCSACRVGMMRIHGIKYHCIHTPTYRDIPNIIF
ncbi:hypothetical protein ACRALDRAFT_213875 [Sodiomyces alcalophilus JCM 7366]|uniref:uncharacterized protein n=1 Tax=Sodiomyces alcalophilus JCM 7366 TaxID=591952 RepID=UPI0039B52A66